MLCHLFASCFLLSDRKHVPCVSDNANISSVHVVDYHYRQNIYWPICGLQLIDFSYRCDPRNYLLLDILIRWALNSYIYLIRPSLLSFTYRFHWYRTNPFSQECMQGLSQRCWQTFVDASPTGRYIDRNLVMAQISKPVLRDSAS